MSLKDQVEALLPSWRRWYPSLFDAATDLGLLRARVCSPDSLLLSNRHRHIVAQAEEAHRRQWGAEDESPVDGAGNRGADGRARRAQSRSS